MAAAGTSSRPRAAAACRADQPLASRLPSSRRHGRARTITAHSRDYAHSHPITAQEYEIGARTRAIAIARFRAIAIARILRRNRRIPRAQAPRRFSGGCPSRAVKSVAIRVLADTQRRAGGYSVATVSLFESQQLALTLTHTYARTHAPRLTFCLPACLPSLLPSYLPASLPACFLSPVFLRSSLPARPSV